MKLKVLNIVLSLFIAACSITSCLNMEATEYVYSSDASITEFSITDSIVTIIGSDTLPSVQGANYPFIIDQNAGLIYNADSLPLHTDISKVVINMTADTYYIYIVAETDSLWEETDSLNFNKPIHFKVMAENGTFGRTYKAEILVHKQDPDSLIWKQTTTSFALNVNAQKAIYMNERIHVFAEQETQVAVTSSSTKDGKTWTELTAIDIPNKADYNSVIAWENAFYILSDNQLYTSTNGINWTKVNTEQTFSKLLASSSNNKKLIGIDTENHYISSIDGIYWGKYELLPSEFPKSNISFADYTLDTNKGINRIVLLGNNESATDTTTVVWSQLDTENEWFSLTYEEHKNACPNLENASIIRYDNKLYTFGGIGQYNGYVTPFSVFYESTDNGISWNLASEKLTFPNEFRNLYYEADGKYSCVIDNEQYIWIIWSVSGEVWRGRINKFGFKKQ